MKRIAWAVVLVVGIGCCLASIGIVIARHRSPWPSVTHACEPYGGPDTSEVVAQGIVLIVCKNGTQILLAERAP